MTRFRRAAAIKQLEKNMTTRTNGHDPLMGVRLSIETITPDIARKYLDNTHVAQRRVSSNRVEIATLEMQHGLWHEPPFTFAMLVFLSDGSLVNGQHRLQALINANMTLRFFVLRGIQIPNGQPLPPGDEVLERKGAFIFQIDDRTWQAAKVMTDVIYSVHIPKAVIAPIARLMQTAAEFLPYRKTPVSVRAPFLWRYLNQQAIDGATLVSWYDAWTSRDPDSYELLPPALRKLWVHTKEKPTPIGGSARRELLAQMLYALDNPEKKILCRTIPQVIADLRAEFATVGHYMNWLTFEEEL